MITIDENPECGVLVLDEPKGSQIVADYGADTIAAALDSIQQSAYLNYLTSLSRGSIASAKSTLSKVSQYLYQQAPERTRWELMKSTHYNMYIHHLKQEGLAPKTIQRHASMVKGVLKKAHSLNMIPEELIGEYNTIMNSNSIKGASGRGIIKPHRRLSDEEIEALQESIMADTSSMGLRDMAIISIMRGCGLRRMEVAGLEISHVKWSEGAYGEVLVHKGKGGKPREVPMPEGTRDILLLWVDLRGDELGPLFCGVYRGGNLARYTEKDREQRRASPALVGTYRPLDRSSINRIMAKRLLEAGLKNATPHDLRYTFAQHNLGNSNMNTVAKMMGHSNISTTSIYTEASKDEIRTVIAMDKVFLKKNR